MPTTDKQAIAALFDLDGTLIDSEEQYTEFWVAQGIKYHNDSNLGLRIKGCTLKHIIANHFQDVEKQVVSDLNVYESKMRFPYIEGSEKFVETLRKHHVKTAIVTSSDLRKMNYVFEAHPEIKSLFDLIIMSEDYSRSKPDPDCFLTAARKLNVEPQNCFVFEDSRAGLQAGNNANMNVIRVVSTYTSDDIQTPIKLSINNFNEISYEKMMLLL